MQWKVTATVVVLALLILESTHATRDSGSSEPPTPPDICSRVRCARPLCDNPLPLPPGQCCQVCPDPPALICPPIPPGTGGICVEECSSDEDCSKGEKCCSNGCGHVCTDAISTPPWPITKSPPTVDCSAVLCAKPSCSDPLPPPPGHCCPTCPDPTEPPTLDCRVIFCVKPDCDDPLPPPPGQCCPTCPVRHYDEPPTLDCRVVLCAAPKCDVPLLLEPGQCCPVCPEPTDPPLICPPIPPGTIGICVEECSSDYDCNEGKKCCSNGCGHVCTDPIPDPRRKQFCVYNGKFYKVGESFPSDDGCNTCSCFANGKVLCTLRFCPPTPSPSPPPPPPVCKYRGQTYQVGDRFPAGDDCNTCFCREGGKVVCTRKQCKEPPTCPPDKPQFYCFVDPCQVTDCPAHPDATCTADYCGGCNARFFDSDGNEVTDTCDVQPPTCPPDKPMVYCFVDPCQVTDCPAHPDATCVADYCGGCNARFYDSDGNEVTDTCTPQDICKLDPETGPCRAYIPSYFYNSTSGQCEIFIYGGCGGNGNRFTTAATCLKRCGPPCEIEGAKFQECATCPATCTDPNLVCAAVCRPGCGCPPGQVIDEVKKQCVDPQECPDICKLPPDTGPCEALIQAYFYNSTSGKCERFTYGGCLGNQNRFGTEEECQDRCDPTAEPECPPECSVEFCRSGLRKNRKALCSIPGPREVPGCTGPCQVTYCHACYFSEEPREPSPVCTACGAPVTDLRCLKRWAHCVRSLDFLKTPRDQRTEENFKCYRYPCTLRG